LQVSLGARVVAFGEGKYQRREQIASAIFSTQRSQIVSGHQLYRTYARVISLAPLRQRPRTTLGRSRSGAADPIALSAAAASSIYSYTTSFAPLPLFCQASSQSASAVISLWQQPEPQNHATAHISRQTTMNTAAFFADLIYNTIYTYK